MKTIVYIDGFNLYYRALRNSNHRWLDINKMCRVVLPRSSEIIRVNYYTARVSGRVDPLAPARQHAYLRALGTLPSVQIHYGNFQVSKKWVGLVQPPDFRPVPTQHAIPTPVTAWAWKTEEKGSDVNLGAHLVRDASIRAMDCAAVLTNDTDLMEPLRIAVEEFGIHLILLSPSNLPAVSLQRYANSVRHIQSHLGGCLLSNPVVKADGTTIQKPLGW